MSVLHACLDPAMTQVLTENGFDACDLNNLGARNLNGVDIVVIGNNANGKEEALRLAERGIADIRLSYLDLNVDDNLGHWLKRPKHLHWDDVVPLSELAADEDFATYPSGIGFLDKNLGWRWRLPELAIVAGPYGSGKSTVAQLLAANFVRENGEALGSGAMLCSWEDLASEVVRNFRCFGDSHWVPNILDKISFVRRPPEEDRLVDWFMNLVRYHKERYGTRFFTLDPWNEMDHQKDARQSETEYVKEMMKCFRRLVDAEKIILLIITHIPAKYIKGDGSIEPFKIGHSFGSSQFGNKADRGICICRTKKMEKTNGHTVLRLDKSKIERKMGRRGTIAARFDDRTFSLEYDGYATQEVEGIWKD